MTSVILLFWIVTDTCTFPNCVCTTEPGNVPEIVAGVAAAAGAFADAEADAEADAVGAGAAPAAVARGAAAGNGGMTAAWLPSCQPMPRTETEASAA